MLTKPEGTDRRVFKTKRAIHNAFAKLLTEKEVSDITVTELSNEANINRKTFYNYYSGVHQVADEMLKEISDSYDMLVSTVSFERDMNSPYQLFEKMTALLNMDPEFFGYVLTMNGNQRLATEIVNLIKSKTKEAMLKQLHISDELAEIVLNYALAGLLAVYQQWLVSDKRKPLEDVSRVISIMCFKGLNGVLAEIESTGSAQ